MVNNMTIKEKIGQMLMVGMDTNYIDSRIENLIKNYNVGGVILYKKNFKTYSEMIKLISELKKLNSSNKAPLLIAVDQEGGRVNRMPSEIHNIYNAHKLASAKDIEIIKEAGKITGELLQKSGYNMNFAPVLDVLKKETSEGIGNRCLGDSYEEVSKNGIEIMKQMQEHKIISVIKHFPGQGAAKVDSHYVLPRLKKVAEEDTMPFETAIKNGADAIMVGHMVIKNISKVYPVSLSSKMVRKIRLKYKFKGVIMTDDLKMRAIRYVYGTKTSLKMAFLAGNDMVLFRFKEKEEIDAIESIIKLVKEGKIKERRINKSVQRILKLKEKYEIDDNKEIEGCNIEEINSRIDKLNELVENK